MTEVWIPSRELSLEQREASMAEKWCSLYQKTEHAEIAFLSIILLSVVEWTGDERGGWEVDLSRLW